MLFSLRPLMAMRLNAKAFALVSGLRCRDDRCGCGGSGAGVVSAGCGSLSRQPGPAPAAWQKAARRGRSGRWFQSSSRRVGGTRRQGLRRVVVGPGLSRRALPRSLLWTTHPTRRSRTLWLAYPSDCCARSNNIGQSAARNLAAAEAQGELLAFIDNDCVADSGWLRNLVPYLDEPAVGIVGGRVIAPPPAGRVGAFEAVRSPLDMGAVGGPVGPDEIVAYLPTCNLIVRRDCCWRRKGSPPTCALERTWISSGARCGLACVPAMRLQGRSSIITAYASARCCDGVPTMVHPKRTCSGATRRADELCFCQRQEYCCCPCWRRSLLHGRPPSHSVPCY